MITNNKILNTLTENDIPYTVTKEGITLDNFYKSNTVKLIPINETKENFMAYCRYDWNRIINTFEDLVRLNYDWWMYSKNRGYSGWEKPNELWLKHMINLGLNVEHNENR